MRRLILAIALLVASAPAALAGQLLVVGSTDPLIPPGTVLDGDAPVTVAEGAELRLLFEDGTPLALKGPFSGPMPQPAVAEPSGASEGPPLVEALAGMVGEGKVDSSEFGAVRAAPGASASDPWTVDLSKPGLVCVQPGGRPTIWHSVAGEGMLRMLDGSAEAKLAFAAEGPAQPWPSALPVSDGGGYAFVPATGSPILMTLKRTPAAMPTLAHVIRWLNDNGCRRQARLLLRDMAMPDPARSLSVVLGTPHGTTPSYRIGETLTIELAVSENAYVRCFYGQADGTTVQLFPNRFNPSPRLAGPFVHTIPHARDPFSITLGGPAGRETVRCFAWRTDPEASLPADVRTADVTKPLARPFDVVAREITGSSKPPAADSSLVIEVTK